MGPTDTPSSAGAAGAPQVPAYKLEAVDIHKSFGSERVLKGITLRVKAAERRFIIGPSGGGKSTLLRCINNLVAPDRGMVLFDGVPVASHLDAQGRLVKVARRQTDQMRARMPMVFQRFNLFANLDVLHNVTEAQRRVLKRSREEAEAIAMAVLDRVGLSKKTHSDVASLSGGQQQRVAIARALAMKPEVILFDEPTSSLDPENVGEVLAVMKEVAADGMTIVVVTHEMTFARRTADVITLVRDGVIVESGTPREMMESPRSDYTRSFIGGLSNDAG